MELITFVLLIGGKALYTALVVFLMAIPSGMGLGLGLHLIKKLFALKRKKDISTNERINSDYKDFLVQEEQAAAAAAS